MKNQKVLVIMNPVAGRKKAGKLLSQIVDALCRNDCITSVYTTSKKNDAVHFVREHGSEFHRIICCGGDGTLNEIFTGLTMENLQIPVGFIPTGTTNDLGHALDLPGKASQAINVAVDEPVRQHDIGTLNQKQCFSYIASFGAFTKVAYTTPQWLKNILGWVSYFFSGALSLGEIHPQTAKVIADGKEIAGDFIFGSVSNSTVLGGLIKFPQSDICFNDGKFEVLLIENPESLRDLAALIRSILHHRYDNPKIHLLKAGDVSFAFEKSVEWTIDGECAGVFDNVCIKNLQGMALIACPQGKKEQSGSQHRGALWQGHGTQCPKT